MRDTFIRTLSKLAEEDPRIVLVTGDLGFGVVTDFATRYPRQFLNAGVAEQNMTGVATGLALHGRVVFTYSIANFPTLRCLEQIRNDVCYHDADVKIVSVGGGFSYGALGVSHHATEDLSVMRSLPNISVIAPGDRWEASEATKAIASAPGPAYLRLDKTVAPDTNRPDDVFRIGHARTLRVGTDLTIIAAGGILADVLRAADELSVRGIRCRVLSMHTIKPLDADAVLSAVTETGGILTVEEHTIYGGLGGAIAEACLDAGIMPRRFARLALRAGFSSIVGTQEFLRNAYGLDATSIVSRAEELLSTPSRA